MSRRLAQSENYMRRLGEQARAHADSLNRLLKTPEDFTDDETEELLRGAADLLEEIGDAL